MPKQPSANPKIEWKGREFHVTLPLPDGTEVAASWRPVATSVIRIRELGSEEWSPGFETPLNSCGFVGLKPDTEYEVQVTHKNDVGEGGPAFMRIMANRKGNADNVIPFPRK